jgi:hypothetical protein
MGPVHLKTERQIEKEEALVGEKMKRKTDPRRSNE